MSFDPIAVYRCPGDQAGPVHSWAIKGIASQEELDAALADGWHVSLPEAYAACDAALAPKPLDIPAPVLPEPEAIPDDNAPPTRAEMEAQATRMGLQIDRRWSDKTLLAKIEEALKADEGL